MPHRAALKRVPWDGPALAERLGVPVVVHASVGSTMEEARAGQRVPAIHLADEQRAGRGRHGRRWISPPGNLYATIAWTDPAREIPPAVLAAIQAEMAASIREAGGPEARCKWPNDGYVEGGKWSGLVAEHEARLGALLIGLGANLETAPAGPALGAAALRPAWPEWPGRTAVAEILLGAALGVLRDGERGIRRGLARWPDLDLWPLGAAVRVERGAGTTLEGRYGGLGPDGRLILETADGEVRIEAGEARRLRRQDA